MSSGSRSRIFYASTPQPSPPGTPRKNSSKDETLLKNLANCIENRNFPDAMRIIRKMEKFEADFEKLAKMEQLENDLKNSGILVESTLQQISSLKKENQNILEEVQKLKNQVKNSEKLC